MTSTKHTAAHEAAQAQPCPNPGQQPQARACDACIHKGGTLPSDWHALDYFDRRAVAGQASHRLACTAVPDTDKPCLNREPDRASQAPAAIESGALPAAQQIPVMFGQQAGELLALQCLSMVRHSVKSLQREINREAMAGKPWGDAEVELDNVIHLVATGLQALHERPLTNLAEFETAWWRLSQVMNMCCRVHTDKESALYRFLHGVALELESLPYLWEHVIGQGEDTP